MSKYNSSTQLPQSRITHVKVMRTHTVNQNFNLSAIKREALISFLLLMSVFNYFKWCGRGRRCLWLVSKRKIPVRWIRIEDDWLITNIKKLYSPLCCCIAPLRFPCDHLDLKLMQMIHKYCTGSYLFKQIVTQCKSNSY